MELIQKRSETLKTQIRYVTTHTATKSAADLRFQPGLLGVSMRLLSHLLYNCHLTSAAVEHVSKYVSIVIHFDYVQR